MEIRLENPKEILANMQTMLHKYKNAVKKKRGVEPYISMYCMDINRDHLIVANSIREAHAHTNDKYIIVMVKYEQGAPCYSAASNHSLKELHEAVWDSELVAWNNYHNFITSPRELLPRKLLHGPKIEDHIKLEKLGIIDFSKASMGDLYEFLVKINDKILKIGKRITFAKATMDVLAGNEIFYDSLGSKIIQENSRMTTKLTACARASDMPRRYVDMEERVGGFGGYELVKKFYPEAMLKAEEIANKAVEFAKAKSKDGNFNLVGKEYDVVLDGKVAGISIHEIGAGHAAEATELLEEYEETPNPFKGKIGELVGGTEDLNIIDYSLLEVLEMKPFSWFPYDVEGTPAMKTWIVKNGRFNSYLHTKESAGTLSKEKGGRVLTGNARLESCVESYEDESGDIVLRARCPEARMSTLFIVPSQKKCSLEDLLYSIKGKGLYLAGLSFGGTNREQGVVGFQELYYINSAGNKVPVRMKGNSMHITGDVVGYMNKIVAIGDESTVAVDTGWCFSESGEIPHTASGAAIKVKNLSLSPRQLPRPIKTPLIPIPEK